MSKLLLLSHSNLSESFYHTLELIMGKLDDRVSYITLPYGANINQYEKEIEEKIHEAKDEGILILTDLFGGSPFMISTKVFGKLQNQIQIEIVTGMNLPMIAELMVNLNKPVSELKAIAINTGIKEIIDFKSALNKQKGE